MTSAPPVPDYRLVTLTVAQLRARLSEALDIYVHRDALSQEHHRAARAHVAHAHAARRLALRRRHRPNDRLLGISYGYRGAPGQWWHEQVRRGLLVSSGTAAVETWTRDYFELTELHVRPEAQGHGIGEGLLRLLLEGVPDKATLLSTPEGPTRAWTALPQGRFPRRAARLPVRRAIRARSRYSAAPCRWTRPRCGPRRTRAADAPS